jgi:hypothetical protein
VHVLLERDTVVPDLPPGTRLVTVHRIGSWPGKGLVAVRPDGHVGYRTGRSVRDDLATWLRLVGR